MTILALSGSLRRDSYNTALLRAAAEIHPLEIVSIAGIPLYDGDVESTVGIPERVRDLKERFARASGLIIATPEYNSSIPGVLKNAIDWLSRPARDIPRIFGDLPVALCGATPGRGGTVLAQAAWLPILRILGVRPWFGRQLNIAGAGALFNDGALVNNDTRQRLDHFVAGFAEFVSVSPRRQHSS